MKDRVSEAVIRRLPRYYRFLCELERAGTERVSSGELSKEMRLNASQIRQDFNCFGGFGQQGYGYHVRTLRSEIGKILGLVRSYSAVIVGVGNIGAALAHYSGFEKEGLKIAALFDADAAMVGKAVGGLTVRALSEFEAFVLETGVDVGVIAVPKDAAQALADRMVAAGVRSIWNFAPIDVAAAVPVENVHMSDSLHILTYRLNNMQESLER